MTIIRTRAQEAAIRIFYETLNRVRGDVLVRQSCYRRGKNLYIAGKEYQLNRFDRVLVLGAGKANASMAYALDELLEDFPVEGLVAVKYGHQFPGKTPAMVALGIPERNSRIEVIEAGHPLPDENSVKSGHRIMQLAATATERDLVIVLISGGASALMEIPAAGIPLRDLQLVTQSLLRSGADIKQINAVRSCLSQIKGGGLARACGDARLVCLLLSDVLGNARETIGSGPCWGAPPSGAEAMEILRRRKVPVQDVVADALRRVPSAEAARPDHVVIGDIYTLLEAAQKAAQELGFKPRVYARTFSGEAREVGARMAAEAIALQSQVGTYDCVIAAGEPVVTVKGEGIGGRNQELACAAALAMENLPDIALLAIGTDGTDGPTEAAGGIVNGETHTRANLRRALDENDSYHALEAADALVVTGPTHTNLNDLVIISRVEEE